MSLFREQIERRQRSDQSGLEEACQLMAQSVMDAWNVDQAENHRLIAREAMDEILAYYHKRPMETEETFTDSLEHLESVLRPEGLMVREVKLENGWQKRAFGAMLGYLKDSGVTVALLPGMLGGYYFKNPKTGKRTRVNKHTMKLLASDALCFYQSLPMRSIGIPDLLLYMKNSVSTVDFAVMLLCTFAAVLVGMLEPRVFSLLTGSVLKTKNKVLAVSLGAFLLNSAVASEMINLMRRLIIDRINTKTSQALESSVMIRLLALPLRFFREHSSGELASRAESINTLCDMILNSIVSVGLSSIMSLLYMSQIVDFTPSLVLPSAIIIVLTIVFSLSASFLQIGISRQQMEIQARETGLSYAILNGIQKIRLCGAEKRAFTRWAKLYSRRAHLEYNPPAFLKMNQVITTAVSLLGTLLLYSVALQNAVSVSEYYAFSAAFGRVSAAFAALSGVAVSVASIQPVLEMANPILKAEPEVSEQRKPIKHIGKSIELSHVSFRYDPNTPFILDDLSFKVNAGEYVAIVGKTGCGKSTIVRLLLGFEKPEKGAVFYGMSDISHISMQSLRKKLGVVIQNGDLMQGDIFSNIALSAPDLTLDGAWEAAEIAGLADDIREMPMGMNTLVTEGQGVISGGQKQRLLIARAVAPKPEILILDEATSALDNKTQKQVSDALGKMKCTRIVIAHRLSTICQCDRILVLDGGKIIEDGSYDELIQKGGFFAELVERQRIQTE